MNLIFCLDIPQEVQDMQFQLHFYLYELSIFLNLQDELSSIVKVLCAAEDFDN